MIAAFLPAVWQENLGDVVLVGAFIGLLWGIWKIARVLAKATQIAEAVAPHFDPSKGGKTLPNQVEEIGKDMKRTADAIETISADVEHRFDETEDRLEAHEIRINNLETWKEGHDAHFVEERTGRSGRVRNGDPGRAGRVRGADQ